MAEYLLLLRGGDGPRRAGEEVSPAEMQAYLTPYRTWLDDLARDGALLSARRLDWEGSHVLRGSDAGGATVIDGPYTESKDVVGGFYLIRAADEDAAVAIARRCPHLANGGSVEVRPAAE